MKKYIYPALYCCLGICLLVIAANVWVFLHYKQNVIIDIDPGEMKAMSTDSLHPDPALVWRDGNNIPHLSYNFTK